RHDRRNRPAEYQLRLLRLLRRGEGTQITEQVAGAPVGDRIPVLFLDGSVLVFLPIKRPLIPKRNAQGTGSGARGPGAGKRLARGTTDEGSKCRRVERGGGGLDAQALELGLHILAQIEEVRQAPS